ncbi:MAG TPA: hypothetical protein VK578_14460 [Edaphobacter sp.]|nr:hypothetical protein [Edaphobacter sp.]
MNLISDKTEKNLKKPVETEEIGLTKSSEKPKVNCGTVLRTRMDIDDFALNQGMRLNQFSGGFRRADRQLHF